MRSTSSRSLSQRAFKPSRFPPSSASSLLISASFAVVVLAFDGLALDLQLHHAAVDLVQFLGLGVDLHAQFAGGLIDQVDGLVRQERSAM
jgi:hypothetical protein